VFREIGERNFGEGFARSRKKKQTGNPYAQRRSSVVPAKAGTRVDSASSGRKKAKMNPRPSPG
jgi:hypothetical protein